MLQIVKNYKQTVKEEQEGRVNSHLQPSQTSQPNETSHTDQELNLQTEAPVTETSQTAEQIQEEVVEEMSNPNPNPNSNPNPPSPMRAPESTIPDVVHTVEDIYDFDDMSGKVS